MTSTLENQIFKLVKRLEHLNNEYSLLYCDEESEQKLGGPCTKAQLTSVSKHLGHPLPPSYEAFLAQFNGWTKVSGSAGFLSAEEHTAEWVLRKIQDIRDGLAEFGGGDSKGVELLDSAFMIMLGEYQDDFVYFDTSKPLKDGEFEIVRYDLSWPDLTRTYTSFALVLEDFIAITEGCIEDEQ